MKNEAEAFMSALTTLKLCWAIHKSNDEVRKCAGELKRKFILPQAVDAMRTIELSESPMVVIVVAEWGVQEK
ncbi:hypothetical protein NVI2019_PEGOAJLN_01196 [Providencia alcalifaciens]|uniref:DUF7740 domain-containing protein n=1 Tax=Providencia TaxID=586 RepID=UPI000566E3E9|nr:hypothetical protein [Providencia alcalifaciens]CAG9415151.1 hypothetical protein NVI2019_PEGOAJLN_01196 [Providencia alcalifaciens]